MRTTTLDIFADILQRLRSINAEIEITTTMDMGESVIEDEEGNEVLLEVLTIVQKDINESSLRELPVYEMVVCTRFGNSILTVSLIAHHPD